MSLNQTSVDRVSVLLGLLVVLNGLGLSITYGIIRDHHGTISLCSRPGQGAQFLIKLPLAPAASPESEAG